MPRADGSLTTTERGLGGKHQAWIKANRPRFVGTPCPRCGVTLTIKQGKRYRPSDMEADHSTPRVLGGQMPDRFLCARCNRSLGQALGIARRRRRQVVIRLTTSRSW